MRPKDVMDIDGEDLDEGDKVVVEEDPDNPGDQEGFKDYLITTDKVEPYLEVDSTRFHKSNLDNRVLNNMTKLTRCRLLRVCYVKSSAKLGDVFESSGDQFRLSDTITMLTKFKRSNEIAIIFAVVDRIVC